MGGGGGVHQVSNPEANELTGISACFPFSQPPIILTPPHLLAATALFFFFFLLKQDDDERRHKETPPTCTHSATPPPQPSLLLQSSSKAPSLHSSCECKTSFLPSRNRTTLFRVRRH